MELLADLHRVVAKLKSGGRERDGDTMVREEWKSGIALMFSSMHRHGAMPELGIICSGKAKIE